MSRQRETEQDRLADKQTGVGMETQQVTQD